jgi:PhnB protein
MTMTMNPYLNFDGKTEEAMKFYSEALGGKLEIMRFSDTPPNAGPPVPPEHKNRVMHATIKTNSFTLMASDTMPGQPLTKGSQVHVSLNFTDKAEQDRVWSKMQNGSHVTMPLADQFFGRFGTLTDKFGVQWMLHYQPPQK